MLKKSHLKWIYMDFVCLLTGPSTRRVRGIWNGRVERGVTRWHAMHARRGAWDLWRARPRAGPLTGRYHWVRGTGVQSSCSAIRVQPEDTSQYLFYSQCHLTTKSNKIRVVKQVMYLRIYNQLIYHQTSIQSHDSVRFGLYINVNSWVIR